MRMIAGYALDFDHHFAKKDIVCTAPGFFGHPVECSRFYRCVDYSGTGQHFSVFHFECGPGTIFDESLAICSYPELVLTPPPCLIAVEPLPIVPGFQLIINFLAFFYYNSLDMLYFSMFLRN